MLLKNVIGLGLGLRNKLKNLLSLKYDYVNSLGVMCKANPKRFWSFFQSKNIYRCISNLVKNYEECTEAKDKTTIFNHHFHSVFYSESGVGPPNLSPDNSSTVSDHYFTTDHGSSVKKILDVIKAVGPNDLSPFILKLCCEQLTPSLATLFSKNMRLGKVTSKWKLANVTPVLNKGNKHDVQNFRPISLL